MVITSCNISQPQEIVWRGKKVSTGIYKKPVNHPIHLGEEDVDNDHVIDRRYHGGIDKACYLFSENHYQFWRNKYPDLIWNWGMFGENLTVNGLDEAEMMIGDIYNLGKAKVQVTQPRQPCYKLGVRFGTQKMVKEFVSSGHSGVYVRVLEKGNVQKGDKLECLAKTENSLSVRDIFELLYADMSYVGEAKKAIRLVHLAESCRMDLIKRFEPMKDGI